MRKVALGLASARDLPSSMHNFLTLTWSNIGKALHLNAVALAIRNTDVRGTRKVGLEHSFPSVP